MSQNRSNPAGQDTSVPATQDMTVALGMGALPRHTTAYDTMLKPDQAAGFQAWKAQNAPNDSGVDYDLKGAYLAGVKPDARGHMPDTFKKPNEMTFSTQSQYNGLQEKGGDLLQGGTWGAGDSFTPGPTNLKLHTAQDLINYFKRVEPSSQLILPPK